MSIDAKTKELRRYLDELFQIESAMAVLGYDQQVSLPAAAAPGRARQLECLSAIHHDRQSADTLWNLVLDLHDKIESLDVNTKVIVRELKRTLARSRKLPTQFVAERSRICAESFSVWCEAKPKSDWASVLPYLKRIISLCREEAQMVGFVEHPYDAMLDSFEPYATLAVVKPLLISVAERLKTALPSLASRFSAPPSLGETYEVAQQEKFCKQVMTDLGFDFTRGRLDTAAHPFMSTLGPRDLRITTRYNSQSLLPSLFGTIHETGHAFYEFGLPEEFRGTARGSAASMGIHESQARLWENMVGRSRPFIQYLVSILPKFFDSQHSATSLWATANSIRPSLIRVEADEVTYTLHIVIRMLLEERLMAGDLEVSDVPGAWNELYKDYLGLEVPEFSQGVMQDVHWFSGAIGYFPSYALGNLYGAMFIERFEEVKGSLDKLIEKRSFSLLKDWLESQVYTHGQTFSATDLVERVTGKPLTSEAFLAYLSKKFEVNI